MPSPDGRSRHSSAPLRPIAYGECPPESHLGLPATRGVSQTPALVGTLTGLRGYPAGARDAMLAEALAIRQQLRPMSNELLSLAGSAA